MSELVDIDHGYDGLLAAFRDLSRASQGEGPGVYVGVRDNGEDYDGSPMVQIAAVQEFGSADGHIPERSYLRSTVDEKRQVYAADLVKILDAVRKARHGIALRVLKLGLGRLGAKAVGHVQRKIVALDTPENAASTVRRKGSSNPLIDNSRLLQSIDHEVRGV